MRLVPVGERDGMHHQPAVLDIEERRGLAQAGSTWIGVRTVDVDCEVRDVFVVDSKEEPLAVWHLIRRPEHQPATGHRNEAVRDDERARPRVLPRRVEPRVVRASVTSAIDARAGQWQRTAQRIRRGGVIHGQRPYGPLPSSPVGVHIGAGPGEIADTVLLPGDPLRAEWIAQTYLDDITCYSRTRNMLGFTGSYGGRRISVQGTGMGQPSLGIYVHELITEFGVRTLIRVGSCGALVAKVAIRDVVIAMSASTDSSMNQLRFEGIDFAPTADFGLLRACVEEAERAGVAFHVGPIAAWDSFYSDRPELLKRLGEYGVLGVEMETAALYTLAAKHGARALTVCTVSDSLVTGERTTAEDRERTFTAMVEIALATAVRT